MGAHPIAKGAENVAPPMPVPILASYFEGAHRSEEDGAGGSIGVKAIAHSEATSPSTFSFPSAGRRVRDLALTPLFDICCLARLLGAQILSRE